MSQHGSTRTLVAVGALVAAFAGLLAGPAGADMRLFRGQTVYVPVYSHIYSGDREQPFYLAATLSIRNTDPTHVIKLTAVDYYDSDGRFLKHYLDKALALNAMATKRYVVPESDKSGGSGAKFIIRWQSDQPVAEPLIESVMISTKTQQGISFTSRGRVLESISP
ncbi:hypothetical protein DSCA_60470 [Desulfosarcina alkanivorans]|uniref:DUF3124 domain-containing protein n=1 Tax=Desulfosarcina alkanivorans TaxID=571177 RepID=A0A5K7Z6B5_9BACT|nr:DUF3124 domain-containing protein [Desulfosarcina alkanivorans]BBO72117.1 hypothetical protein DSCA_60470 [Desulfosarcina alkanivorans]